MPTPDGSSRDSNGAIARLARPLREFFHVESAGGIVLLAATLVALVWANSPWDDAYQRLWATDVSFRPGGLELPDDFQHWVNDGLMAIFFLVVGAEIKRELVVGELRDRRTAALPAIAALGGMVVPALIYFALNAGTDAERGWGVPMATDIAFAVGVLALLGPRVPPSLKLFVLTLAIVDDIGAIVVIAVVYSTGISAAWLALCAAILLAVVGLWAAGVRHPPLFVLAGLGLWLATFQSGVHATIAGVAMGLVAPARPPVAQRLEHVLHPWTGYLIVPLFALANAGIRLDGDTVADAAHSTVTLGIVAGLVAGKLIGVAGFAWLAARVGLGRPPAGVDRRGLIGAGLVAGIGFTVSLFMTDLAFDLPGHVAEAKVGILAASVCAATLAATVLGGRRRQVRNSGS
jgi:Na+:H+ antiporter, NhaA family